MTEEIGSPDNPSPLFEDPQIAKYCFTLLRRARLDESGEPQWIPWSDTSDEMLATPIVSADSIIEFSEGCLEYLAKQVPDIALQCGVYVRDMRETFDFETFIMTTMKMMIEFTNERQAH